MPFKLPSFAASVLIVTATYVLYLWFVSDLNLYIHPRYIVFTFIFAGIGLVLSLLHAITDRKKAVGDDTARESKLLLMPILFLLAVALLLPARTLSSATVSQRATDSGSLVASADSQSINSLFSGSSRGLRLQDWSRLLSSEDDPAYYVNKPAKISGFVYDADLGNNTIWVARFVLTCCAVDAQPIGVPVKVDDWQNKFAQDEWIEIEGEFTQAETAQGDMIVLLPTEINKIDVPRNPYAN